MKTAVRFCLGVIMVSTASFAQEKRFGLSVDSAKLIEAVISKENPARDPDAVGNKNLKNKAYGLLQIRLPYLTDVNRIAGKKEVQRMWGKEELTLDDMRDQTMAEWAMVVYLSHYGKVYTRKTGLVPTVDIYARIHNGGPNGWQKENTVRYGEDVALAFGR